MQTTLLIHFPGRGDQCLAFNQDPEADILLDYGQVCKKVLQEFKFVASGKHNIRLTLLNFYGKKMTVPIPIYNPKNWTLMIADMLERDISDIEVGVVQQGELREKKQRVKQMQVEFDSDGSIESAEDDKIKEAIRINKPSNEAYKGEKIVRCQFCNITNREHQGKRELGSLYGPFKGNAYGHLLCLLWCSYIYLNQNGNLCRVNQAIKVSQRLTCIYCKIKGASFYCHSEQCKKVAHYRCAGIHNWFFDWSNFKVYCPEDTKKMNVLLDNTQTGQTTLTLSARSSRFETKMKIENRQEIQIQSPQQARVKMEDQMPF